MSGHLLVADDHLLVCRRIVGMTKDADNEFEEQVIDCDADYLNINYSANPDLS